MNKQKVIALIFALVVVFVMSTIGKLIENVNNEEIVVNQKPVSGEMVYWTDAGWKWQGWGKTTGYYKTQQYWFGGSDADGNQHGSPIRVIFNDASVGYIYGSLRVKLPMSPDKLQLIHTDYNGMNRLMNDLVSQTVVKVVYASGPLMSAFESYAEKKNDLIAYVDDQLSNGVYKTTVREIEIVDSFTGEKKRQKVASLIPDDSAPGGYIRAENSPFSYYGIEIGQVAISEIQYDDKVTKQIETQQEQNMSIQTKKTQALAAQQDAIKVEAEGKAAAAKAKWDQEKIKATEVTKAEQEYEVARLAALKAKEEAKRITAEGEAKAAANRALVNAGLTPLERATIEKETQIGVAEALSKIKLPTIVVAGGNGTNGNTAMDAMGLKMMQDLVKEMSK